MIRSESPLTVGNVFYIQSVGIKKIITVFKGAHTHTLTKSVAWEDISVAIVL